MQQLVLQLGLVFARLMHLQQVLLLVVLLLLGLGLKALRQ
jgi:hypothetical protein